jgi:alkylated DNA repair dioxygenase AlkB
MARLVSGTNWEQRSITVFGREHPQPRLIAWHGDPGSEYTYSNVRMHVSPWTDTLRELRDICAMVAGSPFNSVLLNLYRDGNDTMGWHRDNEPELGTEPVIASLSLGGTRRFRLRHRRTRESVDVDLGPGSLLVMSGLSQTCWEHCVPRRARVVGPRINLTFRNVRPVQKRG